MTHSNKPVPQQDFEKALRKRLPHIQCLTYVSHHKPAKFRCKIHKNTWKAVPYQVRSSKWACPICENEAQSVRGKLTHFEVVKKLAKVNPKVKLLGRYERMGRPIRTRCLECNHIWEPRVGNLLHCLSGCPECYKANPRTTGHGLKKFSLGKRKVTVQGYEPFVLQKLLDKGVHSSQIEVFSEGTLPIIKYRLDGKEKNYWPDLRVKNTLFEVKSLWTLLRYWKANVAKAKAVHKSGHKIKFIVSSPKGNLVVLPDDWFNRKEVEIRKFVAGKFVKSLRILAFDPGVTNFAWSLISVERPFKVRVVESGMLDNTVKKFSDDLQEDVEDFCSEVTALFERLKPDHFIMERFMSRGMKGTTIELVNIMLGAFLSWLVGKQFSFEHRVKLVTAAQWKNEWNRNSCLASFYKTTKVVPHQVDAVGIALYGAYTWFNDKPFLNIKSLEKSLAKQIDATNEGHEIKRKGGKKCSAS